jgi:hypothetical protein
MKRDELGLQPGGLMRCCIASFERWVFINPKAEAKPGENIACLYEHRNTMVVDDAGRHVKWSEQTEGGH